MKATEPSKNDPPVEEKIYSKIFGDQKKENEKGRELIKKYLEFKYSEEFLKYEMENLRTSIQVKNSSINTTMGFVLNYIVFVFLLVGFYMDRFGYNIAGGGIMALILLSIDVIPVIQMNRLRAEKEKLELKLKIIPWILEFRE